MTALVALSVMLLSAIPTQAQIFAPLDSANPYRTQTSHDVVLYAADATPNGAWVKTADSTAAGGFRMHDNALSQPNGPIDNPTHWFELTFNAVANRPYRLWMRLKASGVATNHYQNDSVYVQFDQSVDVNGAAVARIGTANAFIVELADINGRMNPGWGWNDNGQGVNTFGPAILFNASGTQRIRIQRRDDGVSVDQIVLSTNINSFFNEPPGPRTADTTLLTRNNPSLASTIIAHDGFGYSTSLNGGNTGTGFGGAWTAVTGNPAIASGSMTYSSLPTSGNKLSPTTGQRSYRNFASTIPNTGIKWVSFRINRTVTGALPTNHAGFAIYSGTGASGTELFFGKPGFSTTNYGVDHSGTRSVLPGSPTDAERDAFLLFKLDFQSVAGQVIVSMWRNPSLASEAGLGASHITPVQKAHTTGFASMVVSTGTNASSFQMDEFRIGNNFADVTSAGGSSPPSLTDNRLDVVSWNVHRLVGTDSAKNAKRVATQMAIQNADVICTNELPTSATDQADVRNHLIAVTGQQWSQWYYTPGGTGNAEGNGIITRLPVIGTPLGKQISSQQAGRSIQQATVQFNGKNVNIFCTHLDSSGAPEASRLQQMGEVRDWAGGTNPSFPLPRIISGDFNTTQSATYAPLSATYSDAWALGSPLGDSIKYTDNTGAWTRSSRIDRTWFSPIGQTAVIELDKAYIIDTRDQWTYVTSGAAPEIQDAGLLMGNTDDRAVRPSDHNMIIGSFLVP